MFALRAIKISKIPKCNSAMGGTLAFSLIKPIGYHTWSSSNYSVAQAKTVKKISSLVSVRRNWAPLASRCFSIETKKLSKQGESSPPKPTRTTTTDELPPNPFPDKEQLMSYFFRTLAFVWDVSTYSFLWTRKFIKQNVSDNPKYQEKFRQLKQKMDESKVKLASNPKYQERKSQLKQKIDESRDKVSENIKYKELMKKIDEKKAKFAENPKVQEQLRNLKKQIDASKDRFVENYPKYREQLRQLKKKVEENPKYQDLKKKIDEAKDKVAENPEYQELMNKIKESKAKFAANPKVQEKLRQLQNKIDESKNKFAENYPKLLEEWRQLKRKIDESTKDDNVNKT